MDSFTSARSFLVSAHLRMLHSSCSMIHGCQWGPGDKPPEFKKICFETCIFCAFPKNYHEFLSSKRVSALSHCFNLHPPMGMGYTFAPPTGGVCTPFGGVFKKIFPLATLANSPNFFYTPQIPNPRNIPGEAGCENLKYLSEVCRGRDERR